MALIDLFQRAKSALFGNAKFGSRKQLEAHLQQAATSYRAQRAAKLEAKLTARKNLASGLVADASYDNLDLTETDVESLPDGISVRFCLNLRNCKRLKRLPGRLRVGSLDVAGCTSLEMLPEGFSASFLNISDCRQIEWWPDGATLAVGRLRARNCTGLTALPHWLGRLSQLDLAGCSQIQELPEGLQVSSWVDVGGTGITSLPASLAGVGLRWRGVVVDERVAFRPHEISAREVLDEANAELRRVKLERMGFERFLDEANPHVLDVDTDAGGERRLLLVELGNDEPLVCVSVGCPSTGRRYLIRVPPQMTTCRQAVAWTAGFENAADYVPLVES